MSVLLTQNNIETYVPLILKTALQSNKSVNMMTSAEKGDGSRVSSLKTSLKVKKVGEVANRVLRWLGKSKKSIKNIKIDNIDMS